MPRLGHPTIGQATLVLALGLCLVLALGCRRGLDVEHVATSVQEPSNVAVYLSVQGPDGAPLPLSADDFRVYEDGQLVDATRSRQALLDRDIGVVRHTVMLVDVSDTAGDPKAVEHIARGLSIFAERVRRTQAVSLYAFTGAKEIHPIAAYSGTAASSDGDPDGIALDGLTTPDNSRNLHGAVRQGLERLDEALAAATDAIGLGTLVVFTSGPDLAGHIAENRMDLALDYSDHRLIAVGPDRARPTLEAIGRDGIHVAETLEGVAGAFVGAAETIERRYRSSYILGYCSPARTGRRRVRIEVVSDAPEHSGRGSFETELDASAFTASCDPDTPPSFARADRADSGEPGRSSAGSSGPTPKSAQVAKQGTERASDGFIP